MNAFAESTTPVEPVTRIGRLPGLLDLIKKPPSMRLPYDARMLNRPAINTLLKIDQTVQYTLGASWTGDCWIDIDVETRVISHKVFCTSSCVIEAITPGGAVRIIDQDARGHVRFAAETCNATHGRRFYSTWGAEPLYGYGNFSNHGPIYRFLFVSQIIDLVIPVGVTSITFDGINQGIGFFFPDGAAAPTISPELHDTSIGDPGYWDYDDAITVTVPPSAVFVDATSGTYCHDVGTTPYDYATVQKTITDGTNTMVIPQGDAGNDGTDGGVSLSGAGFTTRTFPFTETVSNLTTMGWVVGDRLRIYFAHVACGEGAMRIKIPCALTIPNYIEEEVV